MAYFPRRFICLALKLSRIIQVAGLICVHGCLTFAAGVILFFFFAASSMNAAWLTEDISVIALDRFQKQDWR
jgi:hypothetical protein